MRKWKQFLAQAVLAALLISSVFGGNVIQGFAGETAFSYETLGKAATPSHILAKENMQKYFTAKGCKYTQAEGIPYWDVMAMSALGLSVKTDTPYANLEYSKMGVQKISTAIITMIADGVDPDTIKVDKMDVVQYLRLCMANDGGFSNPNCSADYAATWNQVYPIYALGVCDISVPQEAADWLAASQDADGILGYDYGGTWYPDIDTTCWALVACDLAGIEYPNAEKAMAKIKEVMETSDNSNSYACYVDMLVYFGEATENHAKYIVNNFYNSTTKKFTFYGTDNEYATQQCAMSLAEALSSVSVISQIDDRYTYITDVFSQNVSVRISNCVNASTTNDYVPRTELKVTAGAASVLNGTDKDSVSNVVTVLDAMVEAVCYSKTGTDPSYADLVANKEYINQKLAVSNSQYGLGLTRLFEYNDGNFGYYMNRENMCWSPLDVITETADLFLFHYDYTKASYAVFDAANYNSSTDSSVKVQVKGSSYDANYNLVYSGIPATVIAKRDGAVYQFKCDENGYAVISGLSAGTWKLNAYYGDETAYIVSPYAELTVKQGYIPSSDGGGSSAVSAKPVKTGTWNDPVTDGTWTQASDGSWSYKTNAQFKSTWGYIMNPFAKGTQKNFWFYFDTNGKMLTGWQKINGKWFFLNNAAGSGELGACLLNTVTPDGYTVNENGEWTVNGVVQLTESAAVSGSTSASAAVKENNGTSGSGSSDIASGSGTENSSVEQPKSFTVSVSITANVTTESKEVKKLSGSKRITVEEERGFTAYDALCELCDELGYEIEGNGDYVSSIGGLAEFEGGAMSGWMYSVNGKYPNVCCRNYEVRKGDRISWVYVTSMRETTDV